MPRQEYTTHYIYKITCTINGKYYIGMHSTFDLEDGYMGSGKRIKNSINKHGLETHVKEILEFLPNRSSLKDREKEIVNEELLNDSLCMNLKIGGEGGLVDNEHHKKMRAGASSFAKRQWKDPIFRKKESLRLKIGTIENHKNGIYTYGISFKNKTHSEETKAQMRLSQAGKQSGSNNSQFGKIWIYNVDLKESIKIKKKELKKYIAQGWIKGRRLIF